MEKFQFFLVADFRRFSPKFAEIKKIGLRYDIRDISISLHAKFQGNRTIRLGEKR